MLRKIDILSVGFSEVGKHGVLEEVQSWLSENNKSHYIVTPNPEMLVRAHKNKPFLTALNMSDLSLADGIGIIIAELILGKRGLVRIPGIEMMDSLCKLASDMSSKDTKKPVRVGFLGAGPGVAERTGKCLVKKYPNLNVCFVSEEWEQQGFQNARDAFSQTRILENELDILFIAFGFPKQEMFMFENIKKLPVKVMMGVGGSFDYITGDIPRAPRWIQQIGFEWLYRLFVQPWRWRRQIALIRFIFLVLKSKFSLS